MLCYNKLCHAWYLQVCQLFCRCLADKLNSHISRLFTVNFTCREKMSGALWYLALFDTCKYQEALSLVLVLGICSSLQATWILCPQSLSVCAFIDIYTLILCLNSILALFQLR